MKNQIEQIILLTSLVGFAVAAHATTAPVCHRILAKDHVHIAIKGYTGSSKFYSNLGTVTENPVFPSGKFAMRSKQGALDLVIQEPVICRNKIEYKVHLVYQGKILLNEDQGIQANKWSLLYANKSQNIRILVKVDHKS